jgi:septum formation protein
MNVSAPTLVLASSSPRRKQLLDAAGFRFVVDPADIDETVSPLEPPEVETMRLAIEKAVVVRERSGAGVVLAADTSVICEGRMFGKPVDFDDAVAMLSQLAGRNHRVVTGWAVLPARADAADAISGAAISVVRMREMSRRDVIAYASTREPYDKAGAYAAQGEGRSLIAAVLGPLDNVIGLPMTPVAAALARCGVTAPSS